MLIAMTKAEIHRNCSVPVLNVATTSDFAMELAPS